jgi:hypothetical protein
MKGLLIKDFKILKCQRRALLTILAVFIALAYSKSNMLGLSIYLTFIGVEFAINSASYDEYDNGNPFLFSLPITRRGYVLEKYGFALIIGGGSWLFASVVTMLFETLRNNVSVEEGIVNALLVLPIIIVIISIMYPLQFAFGNENRKIALFVVLAMFMVMSVAISKLALVFNINLLEIIINLPPVSIGIIVAVTLAISAMMLAVSYLISTGIMCRKEF